MVMRVMKYQRLLGRRIIQDGRNEIEIKRRVSTEGWAMTSTVYSAFTMMLMVGTFSVHMCLIWDQRD